MFEDDRVVVPVDFQKTLLDVLHFGHVGATNITAEAKIIWWPEINKDIENKFKECTAFLLKGNNSKYQLLKKHYGKLKKLN